MSFIFRMLLEEYLSYDNMTLCDAKSTQTLSLPTLPSSSSSVSLYMTDYFSVDDITQTAMTRNRAIMLTCLFLEGVAVCAKVYKLLCSVEQGVQSVMFCGARHVNYDVLWSKVCKL